MQALYVIPTAEKQYNLNFWSIKTDKALKIGVCE